MTSIIDKTGKSDTHLFNSSTYLRAMPPVNAHVRCSFEAAPFREAALIFVAVALTVLLAAIPAHAQERTPPARAASPSAEHAQQIAAQPLRGGLKFAVGFPQDDFQQLTGNVGYGVTASMRTPLRQLPLELGADLGLLFFEGGDRSVAFSPGEAGPIETTVRYGTDVFTGHAVARFQPERGGFSPYAEGLLGFKYIFSDARIERQLFPGDFDPSDAASDLSDWALSYGAGAGLEVDVLRAGTSPLGAVVLSAEARYLFGSDAGCVREGDGAEACVGTTLLVPQVGLTIGL